MSTPLVNAPHGYAWWRRSYRFGIKAHLVVASRPDAVAVCGVRCPRPRAIYCFQIGGADDTVPCAACVAEIKEKAKP